jgi:hypothetical protein
VTGKWLSIKSLIAIVLFVMAGLLLRLAPRYFLGLSDGSADRTERRYEILRPDHAPVEIPESSALAVAITPDGNRPVCAGAAAVETTQLYVRDLSEVEARSLRVVEGCRNIGCEAR